MSLAAYEQLPQWMKDSISRQAWLELDGKRWQLSMKRLMDLMGALGLLIILVPVTGGIVLALASQGDGPILFRQTRIGRYGKPFTILKFRTMSPGSQRKGGLSVAGDQRVTPLGRVLRRYRLDELPQLVNVLRGEMSLVGPRPELPEFVQAYTPQMRSTLLLPVGMTSRASIRFRDEAKYLSVQNSQEVYLKRILPEKMAWNVDYLKNFSLIEDIKILLETLQCVMEME